MISDSTLYIDGDWTIAPDQLCYSSINPANETIVGECCLATETQVADAVAAADRAFHSWREIPVPVRASYILKIVEILKQEKMKLAKMMTLEMGKVLNESLGEVDVVIQHGEYMVGEGRRMFGQIVPSGFKNRSIQMVREPIGVVGCITPWNFPVSLAAYKIFSALLTGNTVVWKPALEVSLSAKIFTEIIDQAEVPKGVFNMITGSGHLTGSALANHADVKVIAFTGSTEIGQKLSEFGSKTLKRVSLELGGKNAVIVLKDADIEQAASGIIQSAFVTSGQRCTAASRVIVEKSVKDDLIKRLVEKTRQLQVGDGLEDRNDIGPIVNNYQLQQIEKYVNIGVSEGGKIEVGGKRVTSLSGYFYEPTIISNVKPNDTIAQDEIFGPVLAVIEASSYEEAMKINNDTKYGLSTSIYTNNLRLANIAAREAMSGLVYINSGTSNAEMGVAFGGMKMSGNGHREVSHHAFDVMTEWKSIYTNY